MGIKTINLRGQVPESIGHYSHAVELDNGLILLSGQKAWKPECGEKIEGGIEAQTEQVLNNIEAILKSLNLDWSNVARVQCHLANVKDYPVFDLLYARRLGQHRPARSTLAGYDLRGGALIELVVEAYRY